MVRSDAVPTKEEKTTLTALIIADSFDRRFSAILDESSSLCLVKIANIPILNYTLEWLTKTEIRDVIIVVSSSHQTCVDDFVETWKEHFETLNLISCQNCMCVGDAIREAEGRSLLTSDFLLIANPATFCTSGLVQEIKAYRERRKDKNNVMTLLYAKREGKNPMVGMERKTNKLVFYHRNMRNEDSDLDKALFVADTQMRRDIFDTGIAICSANIGAQFSDNFDFQHRDDVIKEIIANEEILCQSIHVHILPDKIAAVNVRDYEGLVIASRLVLQRWTMPLVPGRVGRGRFAAKTDNVFCAVSEKDRLQPDRAHSAFTGSGVATYAIFGVNCHLDSGVKVKRAAIGNNTKIGEDSEIMDCVIGDGVTIGKRVKVSTSFISNGVTIEDGAQVENGCILGENVSIPASRKLKAESVISSVPCASDEENIVCSTSDLGYEWKLADGGTFWKEGANGRRRYDTSNSTSQRGMDLDMSDGDDEEEKVMDSTEKFFEEVKESMDRIAAAEGNGEHLVRNLILEINSSKLAYNISMEDVAKFVMLSFLSLQHNSNYAALNSLVKKWRVLFENYYKPPRNQIQMLIAVEEMCSQSESFKKMAAKTVHMLYVEDIAEEDAILEWFQSLADDASIKNIVTPIIEWLQQSEEEESD